MKIIFDYIPFFSAFAITISEVSVFLTFLTALAAFATTVIRLYRTAKKKNKNE